MQAAHDEEEYTTEEEELVGEQEEEEEEGLHKEAAGQQGEEEEEEEEVEEEDDEKTPAAPWGGLAKLPERADVLEHLGALKEQGFKQLNVLLLGKSSVGKSSTVNNLLGETAARVQAFKLQADAETITPFKREVPESVSTEVAGMRINLLDTVGLEDSESGDAVNLQALKKIAEEGIMGKPIDVVLYVDRLDLYRVDALDKGIIQAVSDTFGKSIWKKTVLVFTHGNIVQPPPGVQDYDTFADRRAKALRGAISGRSPFFRPQLPAVLVENNSDTCPTDKEGRRLLPDGSQWVPSLFETMRDMALARRPYRYKPSMTRRPNAQFKWLMPVVMAGQYFLWREVIKAQLNRDDEDDAATNEMIWSEKAKERKDLGIGPPLRPNKIDSWRLEQMYDDD